MRNFMTFATVALVVSSAYGHGVQIQVTYDTTAERIVTREVIHTDSAPSAISPEKRVYVMPLLDVVGGAGDGWYTRPDDTRDIFGVPLHPTGPGLCFQYDSQIGGTGWAYNGSSTLPNLEGTAFSVDFKDGLKEWDGSSFVDPGLEQLQMFRGNGASVPTVTAATTDDAPYETLSLAAITSQSGNPHSSMGYRILGNSVSPGLSGPLAGDDGVYLASLSVSSSADGVGASETFYYVMYKNASPGAAIEAARALGFDDALIQVVPEPASGALLIGLALLARRRAVTG